MESWDLLLDLPNEMGWDVSVEYFDGILRARLREV